MLVPCSDTDVASKYSVQDLYICDKAFMSTGVHMKTSQVCKSVS